MRSIRRILIAFLILLFNFPSVVKAQGTCATALTLTPSPTCSFSNENIKNATSTAPTGACGGATSTTTYGEWFKFTATSSIASITVSNFGSTLTASTTYIELLTGTCGSFSSVCQTASTALNSVSLTVGTVYYIRVYVTANPNSGGSPNQYDYSICIVSPPANDDCSGASTLTTGTSCSNTTGTLISATASTGISAGCETAGTHYDVWYSFVAGSTYEIISLSGRGSNFTNPALQLYSGSCGSLTSIQCGTTSIGAAGLTVGNTYYVRVSNIGAAISSNGGFSICVYHPAAADIDYSRSYINVTKGTTGGTVDPGDTLEMRATFVIRSGSADSIGFYDTLFNTRGLRLVPGSIAWRTNEGKIYGNGGSAFTDAFDSDPGWYYTSGLDTVVRLNIGAGASGTSRGVLTNTSRPSVFGGTCIIMATYRVVVYAPYNTAINFKTGALTYRDGNTGVLHNRTFASNNLIVYQSPGLCPNAVSPSNALGAESNGTFGTPSGGTPLARNRGTTPYTTYTYRPFTASGGPNDYYYAIANNTSQTFTTANNWAKPDGTAHRLFSQWDITGDHTGAGNTALGNSPCDTTLPVSASNPCGYMLVINSAYKTDTAFTYNITNLCPNTYYELAAWFKNICYKCGCDSTGTGSGGGTYIPTAFGDSSGVRPNVAFDVNGVDYYTTGDIRYLGLSGGQTGSDAANQWVKRGFTYLTGPAQTSFTLTLRNNAPGGGGNDWALDDIAVATCLPNMSYSPTITPTVCAGNELVVNDTIGSYFNNYNYYKWQRSTDDGVSWTDISGASGSATPTLVGSQWQYVATYQIPNTATTASDNGDQYRVIVGTTASNITSSSCQVTDGVSQITLTVDNCTPILGTSLISFNAKQNGHTSFLYWTTSKETEDLNFIIEGSTDGRTFTQIETLSSNKNYSNSLNSYSWSHLQPPSKYYYRIKMVGPHTGLKYSRIIALDGLSRFANLVSVTNPFESQLIAGVQMAEAGIVKLELINNYGVIVQSQNATLQQGNNRIVIKNIAGLASGMYTLKLTTNENVVTRKLIKQ